MRRPTGADGWPYGRLPWARGLRVARTARAHTRSVGGRAADNPRLVAHGQASSQGWRQNKFDTVRPACCGFATATDDSWVLLDIIGKLSEFSVVLLDGFNRIACDLVLLDTEKFMYDVL